MLKGESKVRAIYEKLLRNLSQRWAALAKEGTVGPFTENVLIRTTKAYEASKLPLEAICACFCCKPQDLTKFKNPLLAKFMNGGNWEHPEVAFFCFILPWEWAQLSLGWSIRFSTLSRYGALILSSSSSKSQKWKIDCVDFTPKEKASHSIRCYGPFFLSFESRGIHFYMYIYICIYMHTHIHVCCL
jgi:hypothetical protein